MDYPRINGMQALTPDSGGYWALLDWALVHIPREEWTPVHVQVLCWRIVTWCVVGVVPGLVLPLWLASDPEALPTLIAVIEAGIWADDRLHRRLPPAS